MSDPPRSPSGLWRSTGANEELFRLTREKLAVDIAAKDRLYRWDLTAEHQALLVRLAMLSVANVAFELRQAWTNEQATKSDFEAPTREAVPAIPRRETAEFASVEDPTRKLRRA